MNKNNQKNYDLVGFNERLIAALRSQGKTGIETAQFINKKSIKVGFSKQKNSGAAWTPTGKIKLNSALFSIHSDFMQSGLLSLIVHEACHLQQGLVTALSVYGELEAWQKGFSFQREIQNGKSSGLIDELLSIPRGWKRSDLLRARELMKQYSPGYKIDLLPLYPIHKEIIWWVTRKEPIRSN